MSLRRPAAFRIARYTARALLLAAIVVFVGKSPAAGQEPAPAENATQAVEFERDIRPILQEHCYRCHGPEKRSGGLRLDTREFAEAGGDSGATIVGGDLESNELYRRVASDERTYRMPKNAPPLAEREIELVRRWISEGGIWPSTRPSPTSLSWIERFLRHSEELSRRYAFEFNYLRPFVVAFVACQVLLLAVGRCKAAYLNERPWTRGRAQLVCRFCSGVRSREIALVWVILCGLLVGGFLLGHGEKTARALAELAAKQQVFSSPWRNSIYGWPPKPFRPDHPKQLAGTYYRGNCERNPELFNGGNYLTSIFRIELCDTRHNRLQVGDPLPEGGMLVRVEMERAAGTADQLFSKVLMSSVFLSEAFYENVPTKLTETPARLEVLEADHRWVAYVPVGKVNEEGKIAGLIYIYTGRVEDGEIRGEPHYGVVYDLALQDGKLAEGSELWMNSFGNGAFAPPTPTDKLPYHEWFDYRPMPVIEGENTRDPKLLGVEEYEQKGLITPGDDSSPNRPDKSTPPDQPVPEGE